MFKVRVIEKPAEFTAEQVSDGRWVVSDNDEPDPWMRVFTDEKFRKTFKAVNPPDEMEQDERRA